jgi:hypothetical protein
MSPPRVGGRRAERENEGDQDKAAHIVQTPEPAT